MARLKASNNAKTELLQTIDATATSFIVADASKFPTAPFRVTVDNEIMEVGVITKATNTFSGVARGLEGTTATAHDSGAVAENRWTAGMYDELGAHADIRGANPHETTAAQVGAAPSSHVGSRGNQHAVATTSEAGFMSGTDKAKLDNATNAATASRLILRDTAGRAKVAAPSASDDIARKAEVDAKVAKPASAVSGNIAVFDGGAGKIKDSGISNADILSPVDGHKHTGAANDGVKLGIIDEDDEKLSSIQAENNTEVIISTGTEGTVYNAKTVNYTRKSCHTKLKIIFEVKHLYETGGMGSNCYIFINNQEVYSIALSKSYTIRETIIDLTHYAVGSNLKIDVRIKYMKTYMGGACRLFQVCTGKTYPVVTLDY